MQEFLRNYLKHRARDTNHLRHEGVGIPGEQPRDVAAHPAAPHARRAVPAPGATRAGADLGRPGGASCLKYNLFFFTISSPFVLGPC